MPACLPRERCVVYLEHAIEYTRATGSFINIVVLSCRQHVLSKTRGAIVANNEITEGASRGWDHDRG